MSSFRQDFQRGFRMMARNPGYTLAAVMALTLGIGASSAIFSVVNAVLLQPFPYPDPQQLVIVWERQMQYNLPRMYASPPNFHDWREQNEAFSEVGAFRPTGYFLELDGQPVRVEGARVTSSLFPVLRVSPQKGRLFNSQDDQPGSQPVALISHRLWQSRFGGDRDLVGRSIPISDLNHTVVGIMPEGFDFPPPIIEEGSAPLRKADLWIPFRMDMKNGQRGAHFMTVIARLGEGVTLQRAQGEMERIASGLQERYPDSNRGWEVQLVSMHQQVVGDIRPSLIILMGAVGLLLLIACVNVANLLLARGTVRQREFAIRSALGAGRWRLIRQLLTESLSLSLLGGPAGLLLALGGMRFLVQLAPENVPRLENTSLDGWVVGFTLLMTVASGAFFGLAPALQSFSPRLSRRLKEGGRTPSESRASGRLRSGLVVLEVSLSLLLLVGSGLLFRSFLQLGGVESGLQPGNVLTARISLPSARYAENPHRIEAYRSLQARLSALPGIESAGFIYDIPLAADRQGTGFRIEGEPPLPREENRQVNFSFVTPGYFEAMGIPLLQGRPIGPQDGPEAEKVILINQSLAQRFFAGQNPVGQRLLMGFSSQTPRRIAGVVGNVRHVTLRDAANPTVYTPYFQVPWSGSLSLAVRSATPPASLVSALRRELRQFDPRLPFYQVKTMQQIVDESMAQPRFSALILLVFSAVALLLASVGIYGVISYSVSRRIHETGIRMVMGASPSDILKLVVGQGARLACAGILTGLLAALALTRLLDSSGLLYGVKAGDPATFAGVALLLLAVALLACLLPARRATQVDPMVAMRCE